MPVCNHCVHPILHDRPISTLCRIKPIAAKSAFLAQISIAEFILINSQLHKIHRVPYKWQSYRLQAVASVPGLGPWAPPAKRGPSLESIYRVSLTVDLCEGNKIITFLPQPVGGLSKRKKSGALGTCPVCPLVKTAMTASVRYQGRKLHLSLQIP